jgi:hypothetical protein
MGRLSAGTNSAHVGVKSEATHFSNVVLPNLDCGRFCGKHPLFPSFLQGTISLNIIFHILWAVMLQVMSSGDEKLFLGD